MRLRVHEFDLTLGYLFRRFETTVHEPSDADMGWKDCGTVQTIERIKGQAWRGKGVRRTQDSRQV